MTSPVDSVFEREASFENSHSFLKLENVTTAPLHPQKIPVSSINVMYFGLPNFLCDHLISELAWTSTCMFLELSSSLPFVFQPLCHTCGPLCEKGG